MDNTLGTIVSVLAIGGIAGYFTGYLVRKILRLAVIIGTFAFLLMYMTFTRAVSLNFDEFGATLQRFLDALGPLGLTTLASSAPFAGSFILGLMFGLKRG